MYCIRCGEYLKDGTKYCIYCGAATACAESMNPIDWNIKKKQKSDDDIFDISIPDDFIGGSDETEEDTLIPDEPEDESYTQAVSQADIKAAMRAMHEPEQQPEEKTEKIDFDISVPEDFIETPPTEQLTPDEPEDESYTQAVSQADIKAAMRAMQQPDSEPEEKTEKIDFDISVPDDFIETPPTEQLTPDEVGDESYTQAVSQADIKAAMRAMHEPEQQPEEKTEKIDFDISVPDDFIETPPTEQLTPDEAEDESYTQAVSQADIKAAMRAMHEPEQQPEEKTEKIDFDISVPEDFIETPPTEQLTPDEAGDESYTQAVSQADIKAAMKAMQEPENKPTQKTEHIQKKKTTPEQDIPDIPIPMEFRNAGEIPPEPIFRNQEPPLPVAEYEDDDEDEEEREPWVSARGIALVAVLVVLFFAIAVGAFVLVLRGSWLPTQDSGSGEVQTQVGFWGADSDNSGD